MTPKDRWRNARRVGQATVKVLGESHRPTYMKRGWVSPTVETDWGYFNFAVRPPEQPDGLILFWHDDAGAHSQSVVFDAGWRGRLSRLLSRVRGEKP